MQELTKLLGGKFTKKKGFEEIIKSENDLPEKIFRIDYDHEINEIRLRKRYGIIYKLNHEGKKPEEVHCKKCGSELICEVREFPDVKEISTCKLYLVTVIRYWKCKHCKHEFSTESFENIEAWKGDFKKNYSSSLQTSEVGLCKNCGKSTYFEEFKKPDVKKIPISNGYDEITIRYYQCKECGKSRVLKIEKEEFRDYDSSY